MTVYWLDADVFIQTKNEDTGPYPFGRGDKFWAYLSHKLDEGVVRSPKMVYDEISAGNDHLAKWFKEREHRGLSINATPQVWDCVTEISDFVVNRYKDRKSRAFLYGADCLVLAHAKAKGERRRSCVP